MDRGNYSVEVTVREAGSDLVTLRRWVFVHVTDGLQTRDGQLRVVQQLMAEYNNTTDQYHVVLRCGTFTYPTHPPFEVTWTTPSGLTVSSSSYQDGSFHLELSNSVEGGSYTCRVPPKFACLHGNTGESVLIVDKLEARLALLDARQAALEGENKDIENKNNVLEKENSLLKTQISILGSKDYDLQNQVSLLASHISMLENRNNGLETELFRIKALSEKQVSFHARMTSNTHLPLANSTIIMSTVINNQGNAYNSTSGVFTAPFNGSYCFLASTVAYFHHADMYLIVNGSVVDYVRANRDTVTYEAGSVQAVVHVLVGQRVWLMSHYDNYYWAPGSAFSGFLVSLDI